MALRLRCAAWTMANIRSIDDLGEVRGRTVYRCLILRLGLSSRPHLMKRAAKVAANPITIKARQKS